MKETDLNLINEEEDEKEIPSHLDEVSIKNMNDTNPNMKNELFFNVPSKEEMIKVENCFFLNDIKKISTFYFCSCSKEEFYPICEPCAKQCHKRHNPTQTIKGMIINSYLPCAVSRVINLTAATVHSILCLPGTKSKTYYFISCFLKK